MPLRDRRLGRQANGAARWNTSAPQRPCCAALAVLFLTTLGIAGCRVFRSRQASEENVAAARQLSLQGLDAQQRGQWERAEMLFSAAIMKCPSDERARAGYSEALWQRGDYSGGISNMEDAVRLSGNDPERLVRLGSMYLEHADAPRALALAERAIQNNSQLAHAWALRGQALFAAGALDESLGSFHRAISLDPSLPDVHLAIADIYSRQNRPQRALATLQSLADRFPVKEVPAGVLYREGLALVALGRPHDAIRVLQQAVERGPASAEALFALAEAQTAVGERAAARQAVHLALSINPTHVGCARLMAKLDESPLATASAVSAGKAEN